MSEFIREASVAGDLRMIIYCAIECLGSVGSPGWKIGKFQRRKEDDSVHYASASQ